jgi:hypothetical protein
MPLFRWICNECGKISRSISDRRPELPPCSCGGSQIFVTGGGTMVMETLDNGAMPRKVERLARVEELMADRNKANDPNQATDD